MYKILLIANTDWYLYRFRSSLAEFLRTCGYDVVFVSPPGRFVSEIQAQGFRWIEWHVNRQSLNPFIEGRTFFGLLHIFLIEKPRLIHLHTIKAVIYGSLAARFAKVPFIVQSITGLGYVFLGKDWRARFLRSFVMWIYRLIFQDENSFTVFENEADLQYFVKKKLVNAEQTRCIAGVGVDTDYYVPCPEPDEPPVVLFAGRMLWDKGVGIFVDAVKILKSRVIARFVLVGEPDLGNPASIDVNIINQWVKDGLVEWWGWQADMRSVFASCHIVTLPSFGEGLPTVLLEAAASARAIVASDVPGCRDVVLDGATGILVPSQNSLALANAIETLIQNPELRRNMGRAGREYIVKRFDVDEINEETYSVYQNFLLSK